MTCAVTCADDCCCLASALGPLRSASCSFPRPARPPGPWPSLAGRWRPWWQVSRCLRRPEPTELCPDPVRAPLRSLEALAAAGPSAEDAALLGGAFAAMAADPRRPGLPAHSGKGRPGVPNVSLRPGAREELEAAEEACSAERQGAGLSFASACHKVSTWFNGTGDTSSS